MSRHAATADVFTAIADPTRRGLIDMLSAGEQPVLSLASSFEMTLSAVSQHLRVLREANLVFERRAGRQRLYSLNPIRLKEVSDWIGHYERFWCEKIDLLGDYLEKNP
jgi:DNA-binding transcriptional ArsR family regulator